MILDALLYFVTPRGFIVSPSDAITKRAAYIRRSADYNATDPTEFLRRFLAGLAVQRRCHKGPMKNVAILAARRKRA